MSKLPYSFMLANGMLAVAAPPEVWERFNAVMYELDMYDVFIEGEFERADLELAEALRSAPTPTSTK